MIAGLNGSISVGGLRKNGPIARSYHFDPLQKITFLEDNEGKQRFPMIMTNNLSGSSHFGNSVLVPNMGPATQVSMDA